MSKGLRRSINRGAKLLSDVVKIDIGLDNLTLSLDGAIIGFGSAVLTALPEGNFVLLGCVCNLQFDSVDADVAATWEGDYSVGTTATADSTLATTEIDIIASTAIAAATAKLSPITRGASSATENSAVFDNTDGSLELNLNMLMDDADIADDADMIVNGTVHLAIVMLGDD